jgi:hypothetical protein
VRDLTRHYDQLTADERFRLFIEAASRRDHQELDRLNDTCLRKKYLCEDWDYTRRKVRFFDLALLHASEVANTDCVAFAVLTFLLAHEHDLEAGETIAKLNEVLVELVVKRLSMIEGWNRFCRALGLLPERVAKLLDVFGGERGWLMDIVERTVASATEMALEPDESEVKASHDQWRACWDGMGGVG